MVDHALSVAALGQLGGDVLVKIEEMREKLSTKNLSSYGELVAERAAHARALMDNTRLHQDRKTTAEEKNETVRLFVVKRNKWKNGAVIEQFNKDIPTTTLKVAEETNALTTLL